MPLKLLKTCLFCALILCLLYTVVMWPLGIGLDKVKIWSRKTQPTKADQIPKVEKRKDPEPTIQPIDIVYMWVNGSDPALLESINHHIAKLGIDNIQADARVSTIF